MVLKVFSNPNLSMVLRELKTELQSYIYEEKDKQNDRIQAHGEVYNFPSFMRIILAKPPWKEKIGYTFPNYF